MTGKYSTRQTGTTFRNYCCQIWVSTRSTSLFKSNRIFLQCQNIAFSFNVYEWNVFHCILAIRLCHGFLSQLSFWHQIFRMLLTLDHCRHQTHTQNINAISTTNADTPHDNTGKLQIDKSNLNVTLWHCMKKSDYFWTRVRKSSRTFLLW